MKQEFSLLDIQAEGRNQAQWSLEGRRCSLLGKMGQVGALVPNTALAEVRKSR
jgi:hypothetical protein